MRLILDSWIERIYELFCIQRRMNDPRTLCLRQAECRSELGALWQGQVLCLLESPDKLV